MLLRFDLWSGCKPTHMLSKVSERTRAVRGHGLCMAPSSTSHLEHLHWCPEKLSVMGSLDICLPIWGRLPPLGLFGEESRQRPALDSLELNGPLRDTSRGVWMAKHALQRIEGAHRDPMYFVIMAQLSGCQHYPEEHLLDLRVPFPSVSQHRADHALLTWGTQLLTWAPVGPRVCRVQGPTPALPLTQRWPPGWRRLCRVAEVLRT